MCVMYITKYVVKNDHYLYALLTSKQVSELVHINVNIIITQRINYYIAFLLQ